MFVIVRYYPIIIEINTATQFDLSTEHLSISKLAISNLTNDLLEDIAELSRMNNSASSTARQLSAERNNDSSDEMEQITLSVIDEYDGEEDPPLVPYDMMKYLPKRYRKTTCFFAASDRHMSQCMYCSRYDMQSISIYVEKFTVIDNTFHGLFKEMIETSKECDLPNGAVCNVNRLELESDAIIKYANYLSTTLPLRYCYPQTVVLFNPRSLHSKYLHGYDMYSEIIVDHSPKSEVYLPDTCKFMETLLARRNLPPPDPAKRHGTAMFISQCTLDQEERTEMLNKLFQVIKLDSYGLCLHNIPPPVDLVTAPNETWKDATARQYRTVIIYEPSSQVVSTRIWRAYLAGAIPVYNGSREVYERIPGAHSIINMADFENIEDLAAYLLKVESNDTLYKMHAKLDFDAMGKFLEKHCQSFNVPLVCQICSKVYQYKLASYVGGNRPCNCRNQPEALGIPKSNRYQLNGAF